MSWSQVTTETKKTTYREDFDNAEDPEEAQFSDQEKKRETSHNFTHKKDEDFTEFVRVPKGGTLADGVKIGEGTHFVKENIGEYICILRQFDTSVQRKRGRELRSLASALAKVSTSSRTLGPASLRRPSGWRIISGARAVRVVEGMRRSVDCPYSFLCPSTFCGL